MNPMIPVFVCGNVGERMRGTQPICGQLSTQKDRQMTVTNGCLSRLGTSREDFALPGLADVLSWKHTLEVFDHELRPDYKLLTQRVIVFPKFMDKSKLILATGMAGL
jgi:hypothetical protein